MEKPSIPRGTRDFGPMEMVRRNYIFDTIKSSFAKYGFMPIETPAMENLKTLMGKYGEEGDRLIFKILSRGDKLNRALLSDEEIKPTDLAEEALRYDLTVPFARFVVQHRNEINFPFKRYQIQPVWRADRPQRGRYREFYQCDADVVGSDSLLYEVELTQLFDEVLTNLNLPGFTVKINNRKILSGIAEVCGNLDKIIEITVAIDKLDKVGKDEVISELLEKGLSNAAIEIIEPLFNLNGNNDEKLNTLKSYLTKSEVGLKGIEELEYILNKGNKLGLQKGVLEFDVTLARGLNYYTGAIFEVKAHEVKIGSICGGGRYDNLTGVFGMEGVSGVGISFGADRIYDVMEELELFPDILSASTKLLFANFGEQEAEYAMQTLKHVRAVGINAEIYPSSEKMKKQFAYADAKKIPYVAIIGSEEFANKQISLKNMTTGEQTTLSVEQLITAIS
jgi:histidyl-tRNA synthetase